MSNDVAFIASIVTTSYDRDAAKHPAWAAFLAALDNKALLPADPLRAAWKWFRDGWDARRGLRQYDPKHVTFAMRGVTDDAAPARHALDSDDFSERGMLEDMRRRRDYDVAHKVGKHWTADEVRRIATRCEWDWDARIGEPFL